VVNDAVVYDENDWVDVDVWQIDDIRKHFDDPSVHQTDEHASRHMLKEV
jgi:hypothetical protein